MKNLTRLIIGLFVSFYSANGFSGQSETFAQKYCEGNCANRLFVDHDPAGVLSVDEQYLIQYYTESYNILDATMFINAVAKLPASKTVVYRGTEKSKSGIGKIGQVVVLDRINSTSTDRYLAENFVRDQLLVIKSKSARSIVDYSVSNEQEHILLPGTKLRVDKIQIEKIDLTNEVEEKIVDIQVVYLTEL